MKLITRTRNRAYANSNGTINLGKGGGDRVWWHEAGHHIEFENEDLARAARDWIEERATSSDVQRLRDITGIKAYDRREVAYPDDWINPYVGKVYGDAGTPTEVWSMGVEHFNAPERMQYLYEKDPDHFFMVLGMLLI